MSLASFLASSRTLWPLGTSRLTRFIALASGAGTSRPFWRGGGGQTELIVGNVQPMGLLTGENQIERSRHSNKSR